MVSVQQIPETINLGPISYKIRSKLGEGGFAAVYLADSDSGESVAVKLIPQAPGANRELLFENLDGVPNVIPVLDRGEWNDYWVLVMPLAEKSLRQRIAEKDGRLPFNETLEVLIGIANALVGIESRNVVHRDIKPENVLLLNGKWCLSDFGIARYADATTAPDTRKFYKSAPYAAPEQWRDEHATNATDVYSAGVVAHELFAGQVPFKTQDIRRQHLEEMPEPIESITPALQSIITSCLYKDPAARPRPKELLTQLRNSISMPISNAAVRLQRANQQSVTRVAEEKRQESLIRSENERRDRLFRAAKQGLNTCIAHLREGIETNAPEAIVSIEPLIPEAAISAGSLVSRVEFDDWIGSDHRIVVALMDAELAIAPIERVSKSTQTARHSREITVVAYSAIGVKTQSPNQGYQGRSHALLYCDAVERGRFRWYETAFMQDPLTDNRHQPPAIEPFPWLPRHSEAVLSRTSNSIQRALPFTPIDQGNEPDFVERWIDYFSKAALGELTRPRQLPK